jgi:hypothetical protein
VYACATIVKGFFNTPSSMRGSGVYYFNKMFNRTTCEARDFSSKSRAKYSAKINTIKKERKKERKKEKRNPGRRVNQNLAGWTARF